MKHWLRVIALCTLPLVCFAPAVRADIYVTCLTLTADSDSSADRTIASCSNIIRGGTDTKGIITRAYDRLCVAYKIKGNYDLALKNCNSAIGSDPKYARAYANRGVVHALTGEYDRAIKDYNMAIAIDPKESFAYFSRGLTYKRNGQYDRALDDLNMVISLYPKSSEAFYWRGHLHEQLGNVEKAEADYNKALALDHSLKRAVEGLKRLKIPPPRL
jgi:tetratricopeptide (TPR) repeat protein